MHEHRRSICTLDVSERRALPELLVVVRIPWHAIEFSVNEILIEGRAIKADQVAQAADRDCGFEPLRLSYRPVRHVAAVADSCDAKFFWIDPRIVCDGVVQASH